MTEQMNSDDLQFDQADYVAGDGGTGGCATCKAAILDAYYEVDGQIVCPSCHSNLGKTLMGGSRIARVLRATFGGLLMGALGAFIYFLIAKLTGYEIGLVAIIVGFMVGGAVHHGSRGRGGWFYQGLAIILTYCSIVVTYIPPILTEMVPVVTQEAKATADNESRDIAKIVVMTNGAITLNGDFITLDELRPKLNDLALKGGVVWYHRVGLENTEPSEAAAAVGKMVEGLGLDFTVFKDGHFEEPESPWETIARGSILGTIIVGAFLFVFALVVPFLGLPENIIGILIIGFAVYQAWKMNKRKQHQISGPYHLAVGNAGNTVSADGSLDNAGGE